LPVRHAQPGRNSPEARAKVLQAGPVEYAKLRTMIQGEQPVWDEVDTTIAWCW
jgi:hypothetical protein